MIPTHTRSSNFFLAITQCSFQKRRGGIDHYDNFYDLCVLCGKTPVSDAQNPASGYRVAEVDVEFQVSGLVVAFSQGGRYPIYGI